MTFTWIPREINKHADRLANEAMDDAAAGRTWSRRVIAEASRRPVAATASSASDMGPPTTIVLLRHGETRLSVEKRFSGPTSEPLSARGEAQAAAAAARLAARTAAPLEAIVCSPVARAVATAQPVAAALGLDVAHRGRAARDRLRRLGRLLVRRGRGQVAGRDGRVARRSRRRAAARGVARGHGPAGAAGP